MWRVRLLIFVAGIAVSWAANCKDPGFVARSDRIVVGREDQASTADHEPGDMVGYICKHGDEDIMKKIHRMKCLETGQWDKGLPECPLSEWEKCATVSGCRCDEKKKTVSCEGKNFSGMVKDVPNNTLSLSLKKVGRIMSADFKEGMLGHLTQLKELHLSSTTDAEDKKKGWNSQFFNVDDLLPLQALQKFTLAGETRPLVNFIHTHDKKPPRCLKDDCFGACGEPTLLNPRHGIRNDSERRTLFAFKYNGDQLDNIHGFSTIHTQIFYFTKPLHIPKASRLVVVTRDFFTDPSIAEGPVIFGDENIDCTIQLQTPGRHGKAKLIVLKHGSLTVYAERIAYWSVRYHTGCRYLPGEPASPPMPSVDLSKASTICGVNMAYPDPEDSADTALLKRKIGMEMFNYVAKTLSVSTARAQEGAELALSHAMQAKERFLSLEQNSTRYVPFLSKDLYERLLDELYRAGDVYRTHMYVFENRVTSLNDAVKSTQLMVQKSTDLVSSAKLAHEHAVDVLTVSKMSMERIQAKFLEADATLAKRKVAFQAGVRDYLIHQTAMAVFSVLKAAGSIVKGAGLVGDGKKGGIGDILIGLATIGETIIKVINLVARIKRTMASNERLMKTVKSMSGGSAIVSDYITDLDAAGDLRIQIVYWDRLVDEVNQLLGKGEVAGIRGCANYRLALSSLAAWGKALTEETIRQTSLVRDSLQKKETLRGLEAQNVRLMSSIEKTKKEQRLQEDIYAAVYFQAADIKMTLTETLRQYCLSYFYYQLEECSSMVRPKLSDSMFELLQKVSAAKIEAVNSLANIKGMPQPFQGIVVELNDTETENCTNIENCPIATFKEQRELVVKLHAKHPAFKIMQRVKLDEVTIELIGATTKNNSKIYLMLESSGDFRDMWGPTRYNFTSAPFVRGFAYIPRTGDILYRGMVHDKFAAFFIETSPFTTWHLTMPKQLNGGTVNVNQDVDISAVTSIRMHFSGSAIARPVTE